MKKILILVLTFYTTLSMSQKTYLALGDSYTIGEGLPLEDSWPFQLVEILNKNDFEYVSPEIIAKTGWRTDELIEAIDEKLDKSQQFDLVSLLIGVNNQYQEKSLSKYKREFKSLLKKAITSSKYGNKSVFVVSIPDYGVTPFAIEKNKTNAIKDLLEYNAYARQLCDEYHVPYYDITALSADLGKSEMMLIEDKLHPNEQQYKSWIDSFLPQLINRLNSM